MNSSPPQLVLGDLGDRRPRCASGTITRLIPARWAASDFSLSPPTGSTWPVSVISPVIATSLSDRACRETSEASATAIATPGGGAVLRHRAGGNVDVEVVARRTSPRRRSGRDLADVAADVGERRLRRLAHHVAELAGDRQLARRRASRSPRRRAPRRRSASRRARWRRPARGCGGGPRRSSGAGRAARGPASPRSAACRFGLALGDLARDLAADGADLALEVADARPRACTPR